MDLQWWSIVAVRIPAVLKRALPPLTALTLMIASQLGGSVPPTIGAGSDKIDSTLAARLGSGAPTDLLVRFRQRADLSGAAAIADWAQRGRHVVDRLRATADASQARTRARLRAAGVAHQSFWVVNTVVVSSADIGLAEALATDPEVSRLTEVGRHEVPEPLPGNGSTQAAVNGVEWGVSNIGADKVWTDFGARGDGLVVGIIDTGVQADHPALSARYRGNVGNGFDHNHNWFDPSQVCGQPSTVPCDNIGHGTHVLGTMVGDDGAGNAIGVAPAARWIAAKGCEDRERGCSDTALLASAQWMLAPTNLSGADPRPELRPHIVNNSWGGDNGPIEEPWFDEALKAWNAAGIFAVFSNGNAGPACDTAGSPADSALAYSVGAYDSANVVAPFSSRGPGAGGDIRPHISAPGVNIRSAVPGGGYGYASGTSMAAPHVSGAVALLWSAAPAMTGDITGTRDLLGESATDTPAETCGGTDADNNTYGEGRLNAHLAVSRAPRGRTGVVTGVVRDGGTGQPVTGAAVRATAADGSGERATTTDGNGRYRFTVTVGEHRLTVSAFGYADSQPVAVTVADGATTAQDLTIVTKPRVTVHGVITDGSGQGWPLYARVVVDGVPDGTFFTAVHDGRYSFELPADSTYTFRVKAEYPGYVPVVANVAVGRLDVRRDFALTVGTDQCAATGYRAGHRGLFETFDATTIPSGWQSTLEIGDGWRFDDPGRSTNLTGGTGGFASVDSTSGKLLERADLTSPAVNLTGVAAPVLAFRTDLIRRIHGSVHVDVSTDGGTAWATVWERTQSVRGPQQILVPLPAAAGKTDVRVRFRYDSVLTYDGWWQLDDVLIGERLCLPLPGGLVVGNVFDEVERVGVNGATVHSAGMPAEAARTVATPDDPALPDGLFWLFSSRTGKREFRVTHALEQYADGSATVYVRPHKAVRAHLALGVGKLRLRAVPVKEEVAQGGSKTVTLKVSNVGTAPATFRLTEWKDVQPGTPVLTRWPGAEPEHHAVHDRGGPPPESADPAASTSDTSVNAAPGWTRLPDMTVADMDGLVAVHDGRMYVVGGWALGGVGTTQLVQSYDMASAQWSLDAVAPSPLRVARPAGGFIGDTLVVAGGWSRPESVPTAATMRYHPASNTWTLGADAPVRVAAAGHAVLDGKLYVIGGRPAGNEEATSTAVAVYDPVADKWTRAADYPEPAAWQSCAAVGGEIYCAGGMTSGAQHTKSAYVYNPKADAWYRIADMPATVWGAGYAGADGKLLVSGGVVGGYRSARGFAYDPAGNAWQPLPASQVALYRVGSACGLYKVGGSEGTYGIKPYVEHLAGYDGCSAAPVDVPWLSVTPDQVTLKPGPPAEITIRLDAAAVPGPGTYTARLLWRENTRYEIVSIPVTMTVTGR